MGGITVTDQRILQEAVHGTSEQVQNQRLEIEDDLEIRGGECDGTIHS